MSQYNKTVLTHAGLELAKRANAGQAKFGITRAVTSADDWSNKTVQDLEEATTIPNIMQQGTIMDTDEVESNNSVIGVSLCFTNKKLSTGYQIRIIGLYVKEEGQENDFLYAVTTAIVPESMPSFADKVLYKFNMQMYLVIGNAQSVNVVINDGTVVTRTQFDKYKVEVADNLKKLENTHKEDMSHVAKSASINGGAEILPDSTGKLNLVVPDPDLSKYVSLEQLTEMLQAKADITAVPNKTDTEEGIRQAKAAAKTADDKAQDALDTKADKTDVYTKKAVDDAFNTRDSNITNAVNLANQAQETANTKANISDVYTKTDVDSALAVDRGRLGKLEGTQTLDSPDFNSITSTGVYYITNNTPANIKNNPVAQWGVLVVSNGNGNRTSQVYYPDDGSPQWCRLLNGSNWLPWYQLSTKKDASNATSAANAASSKVDTALGNSYFRKQGMNQNGDLVEIRENAVKQANGGYAFDIFGSDQTASKLKDVLSTLPDKADKSQVNVGGSLFRMVAAGKTWSDILGFDNSYTSALVAFRGNTSGAMDNLLGNYSAGVAFGGGDTKGFLEVSYGDHNARIGGGNGSAPVWHEDIAWKTDVNDLQNQIQQLKDNQFEVQTFTDATAAANWEAQKPGKRMAIVNS